MWFADEPNDDREVRVRKVDAAPAAGGVGDELVLSELRRAVAPRCAAGREAQPGRGACRAGAGADTRPGPYPALPASADNARYVKLGRSRHIR